MTLLLQFQIFGRTKPIKAFFAIILQVCAIMLSSSSNADVLVTTPVKNSYVVSAFGSSIGTIEVIREQRMAGDALISHQSVVVALHFEVGGKSYSFTVDSKVAHDEIGIQDYTHNIHENDKHFLTTGRRVDGKLWLRTEQIHTETQLEDKALTDVAMGVASQSIPYLGLITDLLSTNSDRSALIPMNEFDTTEDGFFAALSDLKPNAREQQYRVLNTETLEINKTTVTDPREDVVVTGGKKYRCLRVDIDSKDHTRTACIARDALGGYLVSQSGTDKDGPYSIRLVR
ncbi:hypothetical protein [Congregibacter sp.]|jgi:hypothetical protein|uniref:hypothetical protein n=1 Tax=Congregibacter sp. TaxID=2744308 RepID=UPI0039E4FBA4